MFIMCRFIGSRTLQTTYARPCPLSKLVFAYAQLNHA